MFKHILVPLDGSPLAEQALPVAAHIAKKTGNSIVLLQVSTLGIEYGPYLTRAGIVRESIIEDELALARKYLEKISHSPILAGIETHMIAKPGIPASTILSYANSHEIDLIVLCSHGYTGLKRWMLGSVASQVVRHSTVPVLVAREHSPQLSQLHADSTHPLRTLVALDGSPFAEAILEPAAYLTSALAAPGLGILHLTQLAKLPTFEEEWEYEQRGIDLNIRQEAILAAGQYLQTVVEKLRRGLASQIGIDVTWTTEESRDVAETLSQIAEHGDASGKTKGCDLLALTTHGRSGLQRWAIGNVADRVLHSTLLPLLIVHPSQHNTFSHHIPTQDTEEKK